MSRKYIALSIHTEALHEECVWRGVREMLRYFSGHGVKATWFSINPAFVGYRAMGHEEGKWIERLRKIQEAGQEIQQHTHFYKGKEGVSKGEGYDMSSEHMRKRLSEDREWLRGAGYDPRGFTSGAWKVNDDLFRILHEMGYIYDSSFKTGIFRHIHDVLEIPSTGHLKIMLIDFFKLKSHRAFLEYRDMRVRAVPFHDYDLASFKFRSALKLFVLLYSLLGYRFVSFPDIYEEAKGQQNNFTNK